MQRDSYADFGPSLAGEVLFEKDGVKVRLSSVDLTDQPIEARESGVATLRSSP